MRLQAIPLKGNTLNVDIKDDKPFVVVYCQGEAKITYLPEHGETKVPIKGG
ncbi:XtrA/YqaO family protein [Ornithinibacillus sp. JPR2-1]|uniref:XtrA/YqaO family protein n=1 Tax=Ornithinibacillus sp. JPR2-1 TaxID=2094019 RepID=UPI0031E05510